MKRKNPSTSLEAWKQVHPEMINDHHAKILKALEELKTASSEQISTHTRLDYWQVARRMSELERSQLVYKPGLKVATRTGRLAYVYALCKPGDTKIIVTEKSLPGKSISDYSRELTGTTKGNYTQPDLF